MAEVPSLSEITNVPVDSERGTGNPAVVYDHGNLVGQLNQAAQYNAENVWRKYNLFLDNLKEVYKDGNEIAKQPIMTEDQAKIKGDLASILKDVGKDPQAYFTGGHKFNEIQDRLAKLQSDATESKHNSVWDTAHREFFYRNPELQTDENVSMLDNYRKQPLGARQPYVMKLAGMFDPQAMSGGINELVKKENAESSVTPDGQFIQGTKSTVYDPERYKAIAGAMFDQTDARGTPLKKTITERFNKLPQYLKDKYAGQADPVKSYYLDLMELYRKPDQMTKDELKPNPGYLDKEKVAETQRHNRAMEALDRSGLSLNWAKFNDTKSEDKSGAATVLNEARDIISKGIVTPVESGDEKIKVLRIGDPTLLKTFGNIDKDGNVTNVPSAIEYDRGKDQVKLIYYADHKTPSGKNRIEREVTLDQRTWLKEIAKRSFPNKDIGKINTIVDTFLEDNGNSLYSMTQKWNQNDKQTINVNDVPAGTKLEQKNGKYYFQGKEVIIQ